MDRYRLLLGGGFHAREQAWLEVGTLTTLAAKALKQPFTKNPPGAPEGLKDVNC
jgi:hypothetical protein